MTKWYSSSRQLQILHNLSFTGLCGRAHLPASISNLWDKHEVLLMNYEILILLQNLSMLLI